MANKWIFFLYALFLPLSAFTAPECLFVLFDAGETYALRPVIQKCQEEGRDFKVLRRGTAETIDLEIDDRYFAQNDDLSPKVVVIGVCCRWQHEMAQKFQKKAKVIAYYDNFNAIDDMPFASLIREIEKEVDLFLVPTPEAARSSRSEHVQIVGQPDLLSFARKLETFPHLPMKKQIAYIGGYDTDYEAAFRLFVRSSEGNEVVVCPHPKTDGSLERRVLREEGRDDIQVAIQGSTEVIAESSVVVCHRSTLGIKAAFAGKHVIFFDLPETESNQIVTRWGVAQRVTDQDSFLHALEHPVHPREKFQEAGVPLNATQLIYDYLVP